MPSSYYNKIIEGFYSEFSPVHKQQMLKGHPPVVQHQPSPYMRRYRLPRLSISTATSSSNYPTEEVDLSPTEIQLKMEYIALKNDQIHKVQSVYILSYYRTYIYLDWVISKNQFGITCRNICKKCLLFDLHR